MPALVYRDVRTGVLWGANIQQARFEVVPHEDVCSAFMAPFSYGRRLWETNPPENAEPDRCACGEPLTLIEAREMRGPCFGPCFGCGTWARHDASGRVWVCNSCVCYLSFESQTCAECGADFDAPLGDVDGGFEYCARCAARCGSNYCRCHGRRYSTTSRASVRYACAQCGRHACEGLCQRPAERERFRPVDDAVPADSAARYVGIELEIGDYTAGNEPHPMRHPETDQWMWEMGGDGSVSGPRPVEFRVYPARGERLADVIRRFSDHVREHGAVVNRTCGLHVHVDARRPTELDRDMLWLAWVRYRPLLRRLVSASRRDNCFCVWGTERTTDRYQALNLAAIDRHGTVEFRCHQAVTRLKPMWAWVRLCLRFAEVYGAGPRRLPAERSTLAELAKALWKELGRDAAMFGDMVRRLQAYRGTADPVTAADIRGAAVQWEAVTTVRERLAGNQRAQARREAEQTLYEYGEAYVREQGARFVDMVCSVPRCGDRDCRLGRAYRFLMERERSGRTCAA